MSAFTLHTTLRATMRWALPLCYMGLIYWLSSIHGVPDGDSVVEEVFLLVPPNIQNLVHLPLYALLAVLWCNALQPTLARYTIALALAITLGYGLFDEWHQLHVPGRYASITDVAFNIAGAVVGVILFFKWQKQRSAA